MIISSVVFIIILSVLILIHEFGHFIVAKKVGVRVEKFSLGFGPKLLSLKRKETQYLICLIPLGGYVKLAGDNWEEYSGKPYEYLSQPAGRRAAIIFFGPLFNYLLSFLCFCLVFLIGYPALSSKVGVLMDGYPAKQAGLRVGDQIIQVDNTDIRYWEELQEIVHKKTDEKPVKVIAKRDSRELSFTLVPRIEKLKNIIGQEEKIALIGIQPSEDFIVLKFGFLDVIKLSTQKMLFITSITYKAIFRILTGGLSARESVTGPIGIFYITTKAVTLGFSYVLNLVAILGVSLAIFNLLPLPVFDGGHILFLIIEKIRGRPLDKKVDEVIARIGWSLIVCLAVFIFCNDLIRFGWIDGIVGFFSKFHKP